jgi:putative FmdB family regulatory protein
MPTYEYVCTDCGTHVEVVQSIKDAPLTTCGVCGGRLRKVFHPAGILFKGSGFYSTDSRAKSSSAKSEGRESSGAKAEGKETKKKESGAGEAKEKSA